MTKCTPCQLNALRQRISHMRERVLTAAGKQTERKIITDTFMGKTYRGYWITERGHRIFVPEHITNPSKYAYHHLKKLNKGKEDYEPKKKDWDKSSSEEEEGEYIDIDGDKVWLKKGASEKHLRYRYRAYKKEHEEHKSKKKKKQEEEEEAKKKKEKEEEEAKKKKEPKKKETTLEKRGRLLYEEIIRVEKKYEGEINTDFGSLKYFLDERIRGYHNAGSSRDKSDMALDELESYLRKNKLSGRAAITALNKAVKYKDALADEIEEGNRKVVRDILNEHYPKWKEGRTEYYSPITFYNQVASQLSRYGRDSENPAVIQAAKELDEKFNTEDRKSYAYNLVNDILEQWEKKEQQERKEREAAEDKELWDEVKTIGEKYNLSEDVWDPDGAKLFKEHPKKWEKRMTENMKDAMEKQQEINKDFGKLADTYRDKDYPPDGGEKEFLRRIRDYNPANTWGMIREIRTLHKFPDSTIKPTSHSKDLHEMAVAYSKLDPSKASEILDKLRNDESIKAKDEEYGDSINHRSPTPKEKYVSQMKNPPNVVWDSNITDRQAQTFVEMWNALPDNAKQLVKHVYIDTEFPDNGGSFWAKNGHTRRARGHKNKVYPPGTIKFGIRAFKSPKEFRATIAHEFGHALWSTLTPEQKRRFTAATHNLRVPVSVYSFQYTTKQSEMGDAHRLNPEIYPNETHSETVASMYDVIYQGFYATYNDGFGHLPGVEFVGANREALEAMRRIYLDIVGESDWGAHGTLTARLRALKIRLRALLAKKNYALVAAAKQGKLYVRTFLIDDTRNSNGWRASWESIKKYHKDFHNRPGIEFNRCSHQRDGARVCHLDHTKDDTYNKSKAKQERYRVSTIVDTQLDHKTHTAYAIHRVDDPEMAKKIIAGRIKYLSPSIWPDEEHTTRQLKVDKDASGEWSGQWLIDTTKWQGLHTAWVDVPAYGDKARITDQCMGTTPGQCQSQLYDVHKALTARINRLRAKALAATDTPADKDFWFTTDTGKRVHVLKGETTKEATDKAIGKVKKPSKKKKAEAAAPQPTPDDEQKSLEKIAGDTTWLNIMSTAYYDEPGSGKLFKQLKSIADAYGKDLDLDPDENPMEYTDYKNEWTEDPDALLANPPSDLSADDLTRLQTIRKIEKATHAYWVNRAKTTKYFTRTMTEQEATDRKDSDYMEGHYQSWSIGTDNLYLDLDEYTHYVLIENNAKTRKNVTVPERRFIQERIDENATVDSPLAMASSYNEVKFDTLAGQKIVSIGEVSDLKDNVKQLSASLSARIAVTRLNIRTLMAAKQDPDIIAWFSTEDGVHIPIRKGQTKEQALNDFVAEQESTKEKGKHEQTPKQESKSGGKVTLSVNGSPVLDTSCFTDIEEDARTFTPPGGGYEYHDMYADYMRSIKEGSRSEHIKKYAIAWKSTKVAYHGISIENEQARDKVLHMLNNNTLSASEKSVDNPTAVSAFQSVSDGYNGKAAGLMFVLPKDQLDMKFPTEAPYTKDSFGYDMEGERLERLNNGRYREFNMIGEARVAAGSQIPNGTIIMYDPDYADKELLEAIKNNPNIDKAIPYVWDDDE